MPQDNDEDPDPQEKPLAWCVVRMVEGRFYFLTTDQSFARFCDDVKLWDERNEAYTAARVHRGLVCALEAWLVKAHEVSAPTIYRCWRERLEA